MLWWLVHHRYPQWENSSHSNDTTHLWCRFTVPGMTSGLWGLMLLSYVSFIIAGTERNIIPRVRSIALCYSRHEYHHTRQENAQWKEQVLHQDIYCQIYMRLSFVWFYCPQLNTEIRQIKQCVHKTAQWEMESFVIWAPHCAQLLSKIEEQMVSWAWTCARVQWYIVIKKLN